MRNNLLNIKERILYLADSVEVSKQDFFKKIEITYGNFTGDKKKRPVNSDAIENILLKYPQTNPEWLLTGKGEMLKNDSTNVIHKPLLHNEIKEDNSTITLLNALLKEKEARLQDKDKIIAGLESDKLRLEAELKKISKKQVSKESKQDVQDLGTGVQKQLKE